MEEEVFKTEDAVEQAARRSEAAVAKMRRMFERADKNNSGEIDSEELAPLMQMMYKDWGKPIPHDFKVIAAAAAPVPEPDVAVRCISRTPCS